MEVPPARSFTDGGVSESLGPSLVREPSWRSRGRGETRLIVEAWLRLGRFGSKTSIGVVFPNAWSQMTSWEDLATTGRRLIYCRGTGRAVFRVDYWVRRILSRYCRKKGVRVSLTGRFWGGVEVISSASEG